MITKIKQLVTGGGTKRIIFLAVVILLINVFLYIACMEHDFLKDDFRLIVQNPRVKTFDAYWESVGGKFFAFPDFPYLHYWRPLSLFSFYLDYSLWGMKPSGFHFSNIIVNGLNGVLIFLIFYFVSGKRAYGFVTALFFSLHPSHVEAAAWISGRTDLLSAFFLLAAVLFFILFLKKGNRWYYVTTFLLFCLALLAKENAVLFPLAAMVLVLAAGYDGSGKGRVAGTGLNWRGLWWTLPFWLTDLGYILLHNRISGVQDVLSQFSFKDIGVILKTIGAYTRVILLPFFPTHHFSMHRFDAANLEYIGYFLSALLLLFVLIRRREHYRYTLFSLLFVIFLLPVLDPEIVPSYPKIVIRFAYIPALTAGIFFLETFMMLKSKQARIFFAGFLIFTAGIWTIETISFQGYFKDQESHYQGLLQHDPEDGSLLLPYALVKAGKGNIPEALALTEKALAYNHKDRWLDVSEMAGLLKANLLIITGRAPEGKALAEEILSRTSKNEMKYFGYTVLAKYYEKAANYPKALEILQNARVQGETSDLYFRMALLHGNLGAYDEALTCLETARTLNPELENYQELKQHLNNLKTKSNTRNQP